jgi:hypothetical protein
MYTAIQRAGATNHLDMGNVEIDIYKRDQTQSSKRTNKLQRGVTNGLSDPPYSENGFSQRRNFGTETPKSRQANHRKTIVNRKNRPSSLDVDQEKPVSIFQ